MPLGSELDTFEPPFLEPVADGSFVDAKRLMKVRDGVQCNIPYLLCHRSIAEMPLFSFATLGLV